MVTPSCDRMMPSRDVCTPRALSDRDEQEGDARHFPASTNAPRGNDRGAKRSFGKLPMSAKGQKATSPYDRS